MANLKTVDELAFHLAFWKTKAIWYRAIHARGGGSPTGQSLKLAQQFLEKELAAQIVELGVGLGQQPANPAGS